MLSKYLSRLASLLFSVVLTSANIWLCPPPLDVPNLRQDGSYFCKDSGTGLLKDPRLPQCRNPSFQDCNFYYDCVERYFPECSGLDNYAVTYGRYYCSKFKNNRQLFTEKGKKWITASQKCLQKSVLPLLRMDPKLTCKELTLRAFQTYKKCYINPENNISLCNLCEDVLPVFYTTAIWVGPLWHSSNTMRDVLKGMLRSKSQCSAFKHCLIGDASHANAMDKFARFRLVKISTNRNFSSLESTPTAIHFAENITNALFEKVKPPNSIQWFVLDDYSPTNDRYLQIKVYITNLAFLNSSSNNTAHNDLDTFTNRFVTQADGSSSPLGGVGAVVCHDVDCNVTSSRIEAPTTTPSKAAHAVGFTTTSITILLFFYLF